MASSSQLLATFLLFVIFSLFTPSESATCESQALSGKKVFTFCNDLPALNSYLHWTYDQPESTLYIAFVAPADRLDGWVSWAINPASKGMVGSQALIAFRDAKGAMTVKTYNVSGYGPLTESNVWYGVKESSAEYSGGFTTLYATLVLPENRETVNHVWQVGHSVTHGVPDAHAFQPANLDAKGSLHLLGGQSKRDNGRDSTTMKKYIHGVLGVISWGILFPLGIIVARYMRAFPSADPAWFYIHVSCQVLAYILGVSGWGIGLNLGTGYKNVSKNLDFHRNVGIALFTLATLQVFALFMRPLKEHKYRFYWNMYHHGCGYLVLILGIVNVFKGLYLLRNPKWRISYTVVILVLGVVAVLLEVTTCVVVGRREKPNVSMRALDGADDGRNKQESPVALD